MISFMNFFFLKKQWMAPEIKLLILNNDSGSAAMSFKSDYVIVLWFFLLVNLGEENGDRWGMALGAAVILEALPSE